MRNPPVYYSAIDERHCAIRYPVRGVDASFTIQKVQVVKTSKYYGVCRTGNKQRASNIRWSEKHPWQASIYRGRAIKLGGHATEKEAAIAVDLKLIELGEEPRNILKRK